MTGPDALKLAAWM